MAQKKPDTFLIINPFGIGDVVFSTPLIRSLAGAFPGSRIYYMCNRKTAPIVRNHPLITKTFIYQRSEFVEAEKKSLLCALRKYNVFISEIRREHIACSLDLSLGTPFSLFALLAGIPRRLGLDYKHRGKFLTQRVRIDGFNDKHVAEYYLDVLRLHGVSAPAHNGLEIGAAPDDALWAEAFLAERDAKRCIGIAPCGGEAFGRDAGIKRWPPERFSSLINGLCGSFPGKIAVFAGPGEESEAAAIIAGSGYADRCIAVTSVALEKTVALIGKCECFIGNDTGLVRCAEAMGRKAVILFGIADENVYGPYGKSRTILLKKDIPCRPCYRNFRLATCKNDKACLKSIGVDEVLTAVHALMQIDALR